MEIKQKETLNTNYEYNIIKLINTKKEIDIPFFIDKQREINKFIDYVERNNLIYKGNVNLKSIIEECIIEVINNVFEGLTFHKLKNQLIIKLGNEIGECMLEIEKTYTLLDKTTDREHNKYLTEILQRKEERKNNYGYILEKILND